MKTWNSSPGPRPRRLLGSLSRSSYPLPPPPPALSSIHALAPTVTQAPHRNPALHVRAARPDAPAALHLRNEKTSRAPRQKKRSDPRRNRAPARTQLSRRCQIRSELCRAARQAAPPRTFPHRPRTARPRRPRPLHRVRSGCDLRRNGRSLARPRAPHPPPSPSPRPPRPKKDRLPLPQSPRRRFLLGHHPRRTKRHHPRRPPRTPRRLRLRIRRAVIRTAAACESRCSAIHPEIRRCRIEGPLTPRRSLPRRRYPKIHPSAEKNRRNREIFPAVLRLSLTATHGDVREASYPCRLQELGAWRRAQSLIRFAHLDSGQCATSFADFGQCAARGMHDQIRSICF